MHSYGPPASAVFLDLVGRTPTLHAHMAVQHDDDDGGGGGGGEDGIWM
jgi:hypothetical protein